MTKTTRRAVLTAIAALPMLSAKAYALTENQAIDLVNKMSADIKATVNSGKQDAAMYDAFEQLLMKYADMAIIARFALGAAARGASESEINAFIDAFAGYLSKKYGKQFPQFIGGDIKVVSAKADDRGVIVTAKASLKGQSPVSVDFHVSDRSGTPKAFNVIIEGVNLLTTERTEIGAMLDQQKGSIPNLTKALAARG